MAADVAGDERAARNDEQSAVGGILQGGPGKRAIEAMTLKIGRHVRRDQHEAATNRAVCLCVTPSE